MSELGEKVANLNINEVPNEDPVNAAVQDFLAILPSFDASRVTVVSDPEADRARVRNVHEAYRVVCTEKKQMEDRFVHLAVVTKMKFVEEPVKSCNNFKTKLNSARVRRWKLAEELKSATKDVAELEPYEQEVEDYYIRYPVVLKRVTEETFKRRAIASSLRDGHRGSVKKRRVDMDGNAIVDYLRPEDDDLEAAIEELDNN